MTYAHFAVCLLSFGRVKSEIEGHRVVIVAELNRPAPVFESRSTEGIINLSDLQGRWVLLCFHPADFTPVCSSEFAGLERRRAEFEALSCQILCLSPDSVHAHQA